MAEPTIAEKPEEWYSVGEQIFAGLITGWVKSDVSAGISSVLAEGIGKVLGAAVAAMAPVGIGIARGITESEDLVAPALSDMAAAGVNDMFGTSIPASAFDGGIRSGGRREAGTALGAGLIGVLSGGRTALEPSDEAASRYVGAMATMALEGWYQKWFFEFMTSLIPQLDIGKIENFGSLDDKVAQALGLSRLSRRVLSPIVDASIVTPLRWQVNKTYRPELLTAAEVVRQVARGRWTREKGIEELARAGYNDDRIEALLNAAAKFHSVTDLELLVRAEQMSHGEAVQHLRNQGYDEAIAETELALERLKRIASFERAMATEAVSAFAAGRIDEGTLGDYTSGATIDSQEGAQLRELAHAKRALRAKSLSPAEVRACVKADILAVVDYRRALREDGYEEDAVLSLELLLRHELEEDAAIEELRRRAAEERAAERARRAEAAAQRRAAMDAEAALRRRGTEADLERAALRGLIPIARVAEVYAGRYDAETAALYVSLLEDARQRHLDDQAQRADAVKRAGAKAADLGTLERAVLANLLTLPEFRGELEARGFPAADAQLVTAVLAARQADRAAALERRAEAEEQARRRSIDLGRFEQLVRRGARPLTAYTALLAELGFDEAAIAAMAELLELQIADDVATRHAQQLAETELAPRGLSLAELRRAVVLGLKAPSDYETFMLDQRFTADRIALLMAELAEAVADAETARQRRAQVGPGRDARALPLATVARAARLGIVTPGTYQARLEAAGYTPDDVAIELELLFAEVADVQAARGRRDAIERELAGRGVSLETVARAVRRGVTTLDAYQARAIALGYGAADVALLVRVLGDDLKETAIAKTRREEIAGELKAGPRPLAVLEEQVRSGQTTTEEFGAALVGQGVRPEDAALLAMLLLEELEAAAA